MAQEFDQCKITVQRSHWCQNGRKPNQRSDNSKNLETTNIWLTYLSHTKITRLLKKALKLSHRKLYEFKTEIQHIQNEKKKNVKIKGKKQCFFFHYSFMISVLYTFHSISINLVAYLTFEIVLWFNEREKKPVNFHTILIFRMKSLHFEWRKKCVKIKLNEKIDTICCSEYQMTKSCFSRFTIENMEKENSETHLFWPIHHHPVLFWYCTASTSTMSRTQIKQSHVVRVCVNVTNRLIVLMGK